MLPDRNPVGAIACARPEIPRSNPPGEATQTTRAPASIAVEAASESALPSAGAAEAWPDDAAESAFLAEARDRGEPAPTAKTETEPLEPVDPKSLPALNDLVNRIPADVRETLEELFRARFVAVKRVPKRALKTAAEV